MPSIQRTNSPLDPYATTNQAPESDLVKCGGAFLKGDENRVNTAVTESNRWSQAHSGTGAPYFSTQKFKCV